jgi:hypothetical protein
MMKFSTEENFPMAQTFTDLTISQLTQVYGTIPCVPPVHAFRNKATAQERVLKHMSRAEALRRLDGIDGTEPDAAPPAEATQADSPPAADRKPEPDADQAPPPAKKASKILSAVIEVVAAENPHRPKTAVAQRFALFKSGQTVEEFVAAWATCKDGRLDKKRARRARRQVRKDAAKGYIKLVAA